jgi:hypothetical protein
MKLTKAQRAANRDACRAVWHQIEALCESFKVNCRTHITLRFANGRRLELYPGTMGLHNQGRWLKRFKSTDALLAKIRDHAGLGPLPPKPASYRPDDHEDDFDLIERVDE